MPVQQKYIRNDGTCTTDSISMLIVLISLSIVDAHTFHAATLPCATQASTCVNAVRSRFAAHSRSRMAKILGNVEGKSFELRDEFA